MVGFIIIATLGYGFSLFCVVSSFSSLNKSVRLREADDSKWVASFTSFLILLGSAFATAVFTRWLTGGAL